MGVFADYFDRLHKRRLDKAFERGDFTFVVTAVRNDRRAVRQHVADLLVRGGYDRVGTLIRDACVGLCRERTELWREKIPRGNTDVDKFIANLKTRSAPIDHRIDVLSAVAMRIGEPSVDLLLNAYADISRQNTDARHKFYASRKKDDHSIYEAPIEPWLGFESLGDIARDDTAVLHKLAKLYSQEGCPEAVRGLRYTDIFDEPVWKALSSSAALGDVSSIEAVGKSGREDALDALEKAAARSYLSESEGIALAKAASRYHGDRAGSLLLSLLESDRWGLGDKFFEAISEAIADVGYAQAIPALSRKLTQLSSSLGPYPDCIVKRNDFGFASSFEPTSRSVGALTFALGRLASPDVKKTILRILSHPVDSVRDYASSWTITYNSWTLYQSALAAGAYNAPEFIRPLKSLLSNQNALARYGAVMALERYAPDMYQDGFGALLADKDSLVRQAAARAEGKALAGRSDGRAIDGLISMMADADDDVRASAYRAVVGIGGGAVATLRKRVTDQNLRLRVGVLSCLAELADVKEAVAGTEVSTTGGTIFVTSEMLSTGDQDSVLAALTSAYQSNVANGSVSSRVHLEFPVPRGGPEGERERVSIRKWVTQLDSQFPYASTVLTDQSLLAWLQILLARRKREITDREGNDEYGGGASRTSLLLELVERSREAAKEIGRGNARKQKKMEDALVDRVVAHLQ